jgi:hypothetical protein
MLLCAIALAASGTAHAQPDVLVLDAGGGVPLDRFVAAVRIHVQHEARVEIGAPLGAGNLGDRLADARTRMRAQGAALAVWIEQSGAPPGPIDYVVYAVGAERDRALVEVVRVPANGDPDAIRVMAVKVASLLDGIAAARMEVTRTFGAAQAGAPAPRRRLVLAEIGALATAPAGNVDAQVGMVAAAGLGGRTGAWQAEAVGAFRWLTRLDEQTSMSQVDVSEIDAAIGARLLRRAGRTMLGAEIEVSARVVSADGRAGEASGSATEVIPAVRAGADGRLSLGMLGSLRLLVAVEASAVRQTFLVLDEEVADLGRFRMVGQLSWVISTLP